MSTNTPAMGSTVTQYSDATIYASGTIAGGNTEPVQMRYEMYDAGTGAYFSGGITGTIPVAVPSWSTYVTLSLCTAPNGCFVYLHPLARTTTGNVNSDLQRNFAEDVTVFRVVRYNQSLGSVGLSPASVTVAPGVTQPYVATAYDTQGGTMSGIGVTLTKTATGTNTAVMTPTSGSTGFDGTLRFSVADNTPEITTIRAVASGVPTAATATYATASPTAGAFSATPTKALLATPFTGTFANTGSTGPVGSEYPFSSPTMRVCFTYASGNAVDASNAGITANVNVSLIRTTTSGGTTTVGTATTPTLTQDQTANPGCYLVAHMAAGTEEVGSDAFNAFYNADGLAGYQPGNGDVLVTPQSLSWGQHQLTGANATAQINTYGTAVFSSKTFNGQSFVGRKLNVVVTSPSSSTLNPTQPTGTTYVNATTATCLTSASGSCTLSVTDANVVTTVLTASDNITDPTLNQVATGRWASAQVAFNLAPPTSGTLTATPATALYAVPFTGTATGTGSTAPVGSEYATASQSSRICFSYASGSPIDASHPVAAGRVFVTGTRTTKTGAASTTGAATALPITQDQSANPGCFVIGRAAPGTEDSGSDTFSGYYNADGVAGYQAGNGDINVTPITVNWGQLKTIGLTSTGLKGRYATATFTSKTPDGQAFAGRRLSIAVTSPASSTLNAAQPAGTLYVNPTTAICITDSNGGCTLSVTDPNTVTTVLTASDNITNSTGPQIATGGWGTASVTFNSISGGLDSVGVSPVTVLQPSVNTGPARQRPGDIAHYSYTLLDNNGGPLPNKAVALSLSQGYFTPDCTSYAACTFNPAPSDGNTVGAAATLGQSINATSDANGLFTFATSIARDSKMDATGQLATSLTVIGANGAATALLTPFSTLGTALANANTLSIVPFTSSDALSGTVASNGSNKIPGQAGLVATPGSNFQLRLTDGFGNLATLSNCAVNLTLTPVGPQTTGSAPYLGSPGNISANGCGSFTTTASLNGVPPETFHIDSDNPSSTANATTLTASWAIPWTRFTAAAGPPSTTYTTTAGTGTSLAATRQLSLYAMDQRTLTTAISRTPGSTVQLSTAVTVTAKITDSAGNPLAGATLTWQRSGPNDASGAPQTLGGTSTTSATGSATFGFTSATVGTATIIAITSNSSGAELTRGTSSTTFISGPAPTPTPTASPTGSASPGPTPTPTASPSPTGTPTATPSPSPTASPSPTGSPTATPSPTPTTPAGSVVTIAGGSWLTPRFGTVFTLTGTAPPGAVVTLRFHKSGTPAGTYGLTRTLTTPASGTWTRPIAAIFDYRYYATITTATGLVASGNVLFQPTVTVDGPLNVSTAKNAPFTITGQAAPYSLVVLHFHKNGTPAADYSIVRSVRAGSAGTWSRAILASDDYRYYVSRNAADTLAGRANYHFVVR